MKDEELNKRIGFELRNQRLLHRMTLERVATLLNVSSRNTISYIELGKTSIDVETLIRYCKAVGCDWREVLDKATKED